MNNLQKKANVVSSNQMGLQNIATKYRLLKQADVVVKQTDTIFQVLIPLIDAIPYDYSHHRTGPTLRTKKRRPASSSGGWPRLNPRLQ